MGSYRRGGAVPPAAPRERATAYGENGRAGRSADGRIGMTAIHRRASSECPTGHQFR